MSDTCNCIDIKVEVMMDEPEVNGEVDVSEVILCSDGEDYKRGYEDGHVQGLVDGRADGYQEGYEKGKVDGKGIDLISYASSLLFDASVSEITEDIVLHCENFSNIGNMFDLREVNAPKVTVYMSEKCTSVVRFLRYGSNNTNEGLKEIKIIGDTKNVTNFQQFVMNRNTLERIIGELDFSSATIIQYAFSGCNCLREIAPKANTIKVSLVFSHSKDLTDESIQAIIDGLSDLTGSDAQTLTFHKDIEARMSDEQKAQVVSKNWTMAFSK